MGTTNKRFSIYLPQMEIGKYEFFVEYMQLFISLYKTGNVPRCLLPILNRDKIPFVYTQSFHFNEFIKQILVYD